MKKKKINVYLRKKVSDNHSIENLFDSLIIVPNLKDKYEICKIELPYSNTGIVNKLKNIIFSLSQKADVHHISGDVHYFSLFLPGKSTIITVHDLYFIKSLHFISAVLVKTFWIYIPFFKCRKLVAISELTRNQILSYNSSLDRKTSIIPNFVRPEFLNYKVLKAKNSNTILHIGTQKNKNLENLIVAIADLDVNLTIVGTLSKNQLYLLTQNKIKYESIRNISNDEMISLYSKADILFFASLQEGFGLPILEAQGMGLPLITSNLSPMKEVAGDGAFLVNPYNINEIRKAIQSIMNNPQLRDELTSKGYENVAKYLIENVAKQYEELYDSIV